MNPTRNKLCAASALVLTIPLSAAAAVIVFDPTNLAVNVEQVVRHIELIDRLGAQIRNQTQMLANWDYTRLGDTLLSMRRTASLTEPLTKIDLADLYAAEPHRYEAALASRSESLREVRLRAQREAVLAANAVQRLAAAEMPQTHARVQDFVTRAQAAPGQTAVLQSSNEMVSILTAQLQTLQALETASSSLDVHVEAERQAEQAHRTAVRSSLMRDWDASPGGVSSAVPLVLFSNADRG